MSVHREQQAGKANSKGRKEATPNAASEAPTMKAPFLSSEGITGKVWHMDPLVAGLSLAGALLIGVMLTALLVSRVRPSATESRPAVAASASAPGENGFSGAGDNSTIGREGGDGIGVAAPTPEPSAIVSERENDRYNIEDNDQRERRQERRLEAREGEREERDAERKRGRRRGDDDGDD
jgi:hypothetical protein